MGASFSCVIGMVFRPFLVVVNGSKHSPLSFTSEIAGRRLPWRARRIQPRRVRAVGMISSRGVSWQQQQQRAVGQADGHDPQTAHMQRLRDASKSPVGPGGGVLPVRWRCMLGEGENKMDAIRIRVRRRSDRAASGEHKARGVLFLSSMW